MPDTIELKYTGPGTRKFGIRLPDFKASFDPQAQKTVKVPERFAHLLISEGVWEAVESKPKRARVQWREQSKSELEAIENDTPAEDEPDGNHDDN